MASSYRITTISGIPIKLHITLVILLPLFALSFAPVAGLTGIFYGIMGAVGLFISIVLHELGHALVARAKGCRTRDILLLPIGGMAQLDRMPDKPRDEFQVALAGPLVSLLLSLLLSLGHDLSKALSSPLTAFIMAQLSRINLWLALFNLLPSFPMDGGRIFRAWLATRIGKLEATRIAARVGQGMAWMMGIYAVLPPFSIFLLMIAFFIYQAAGAEYRMMQWQSMREQVPAWPLGGQAWRIPEDQVHVSPPPYAKGPPAPTSRATHHGWFDDLFRSSR